MYVLHSEVRYPANRLVFDLEKIWNSIDWLRLKTTLVNTSIHPAAQNKTRSIWQHWTGFLSNPHSPQLRPRWTGRRVYVHDACSTVHCCALLTVHVALISFAFCLYLADDYIREEIAPNPKPYPPLSPLFLSLFDSSLILVSFSFSFPPVPPFTYMFFLPNTYVSLQFNLCVFLFGKAIFVFFISISLHFPRFLKTKCLSWTGFFLSKLHQSDTQTPIIHNHLPQYLKNRGEGDILC